MTETYPKYPDDFMAVPAKPCSERQMNALIETALTNLDEDGCGTASSGKYPRGGGRVS